MFRVIICFIVAEKIPHNKNEACICLTLVHWILEMWIFYEFNGGKMILFLSTNAFLLPPCFFSTTIIFSPCAYIYVRLYFSLFYLSIYLSIYYSSRVKARIPDSIHFAEQSENSLFSDPRSKHWWSWYIFGKTNAIVFNSSVILVEWPIGIHLYLLLLGRSKHFKVRSELSMYKRHSLSIYFDMTIFISKPRA